MGDVPDARHAENIRRREKENLSSPARRAQQVRSLEVPQSPRIKLYNENHKAVSRECHNTNRGVCTENRSVNKDNKREGRSGDYRPSSNRDNKTDHSGDCRRKVSEDVTATKTQKVKSGDDGSIHKRIIVAANLEEFRTPSHHACKDDFAVPLTPKQRPPAYGMSPPSAKKITQLPSNIKTPEFRSKINYL